MWEWEEKSLGKCDKWGEKSLGKCDFSFVIRCLLVSLQKNAKSLKLYREKYSPKWALRTSLLAYEKNEASKTINIPLYMLFALGNELEAER